MIGLDSFKNLIKQYGVLLACVFGVVGVSYITVSGLKVVADEQAETPSVETKIENAESKLPLQTLWNAKVEQENKDLKQKFKGIEEK